MTNNLNILFIDNGASIDLVRKMVGKFNKVFYYNLWYQGGFPSISPYFIGRGIDGITKVDDLFTTIDSNNPKIDLIVFTDCYGNDLAEHYRMLGKKCYSSGFGEILELDRIGLKKLLEAKGLPFTKYFVSDGISKLKTDLKDLKDKYVKLAQPLRGVTETFHFVDMRLSEAEIDDISNRVGCVKDLIKFIVEDPIGTSDTHVEFGYDGWTASGRFPEYGMAGVEIKDVLYACKIQKLADLPNAITDINNAFVPEFEKYGYRGQFHTEVRYGEDKKAYLIDWTARNGFPPSELMYTMYENMGEILMGTANNEVVEPEYDESEPYGIQIIIHSEWAEKNPQAVYIPKEIRNNVYLKNYVVIDDVIHVIPQDYGLQEIGAVAAKGKTLEQAKERAIEITKKIEGIHLEFPIDKIDKLFDQIELMNKLGVDFFSDKPVEKLEEKEEEPKVEEKPVEPIKTAPKAKRFLEKINK